MKTRTALLMVYFAIAAISFSFTVAPAAEEKALFFDGQNDYVDCPFIAFDKMAAFTIEAWVKNWSGYILNQGAAGDPENGIWLSTDEGPYDGCAWEADKGTNYAVNIGTLAADQWTHIAMQYDGTNQSVFLNGTLVKKQPAPKPGPLDDTRDFTIGAVEPNRPGYDWPRGSGYLRSIRISSTSRYQDSFQPDPDLKADGKTVLLYNQDSLEKSRLVDLSKSKRHGSIRGVRLLPTDEIQVASISGVVRDPENNLLPNISVILKNGEINGPGTYLHVKSNSSGGYKFLINAPAKSYVLYAYKDSLLQVLWDLPIEAGQQETINLSLKPSFGGGGKFSRAGNLVGNWLHQKTTPDNQKIRIKLSFDWLYNCDFIRYYWDLQMDGRLIDEQNALVRWNPMKEQLDEWCWGLSGDQSEGTIEITPEKIIRKYTLSTANGETRKGVNLLWFDDFNTLYWQYAQSDAAGQVQPKGEVIRFVRVFP